VIKRVLGWTCAVLVILEVVAGLLYVRRTNPIAFISGLELTGEVVNEPVTDWSFARDEPEIALETRPAWPHSVTIWCFVHEGKLYVAGSDTRAWTSFASGDPRVRVKIGDKVYPGIATRLEGADLDPLRQPIREVAHSKYGWPQVAPGDPDPPHLVMFRIDSPQQSAAIAAPDAATGNP
jgi:hypothetical protein